MDRKGFVMKEEDNLQKNKDFVSCTDKAQLFLFDNLMPHYCQK